VGSSKVEKTDVRIVAATNVNLTQAISLKDDFAKTSIYRSEYRAYPYSSIPRYAATMRYLLFRKFATDFAETLSDARHPPR
jgi:hypothetical protein